MTAIANAQRTQEHSKLFAFPNAECNMHDANGTPTTKTHKGVTVELHWRKGYAPHSAEVYSTDEFIYADIGLEWDSNELTGYDGVFNLPKEVIAALRELGWTVPADME